MNRRLVVLAAVLIAGALLALVVARRQRPGEDAGAGTVDNRERLKALRSMPYTMVSSEEADPAKSGVVLNKPGKTWPGYNLYATGLSGAVVLMDMDGREVHRWQDPAEKPRPALLPRLLAGGDVLIIQKLSGLVRLDWSSNIVWHRRMIPHHDIAILPDSTFIVLDAEVKRHRGLSVKYPTIVHMDLDGHALDVWSAYENTDAIKAGMDTSLFLDTILNALYAEYGAAEGRRRIPPELLDEDGDASRTVHDYFHANTLTVLGENPLGRTDERFRPGNILTCFRNVNQVLILDSDTHRVVWSWGEGELEWPHHPTMVENGDILIFDNGVSRGYSRLLEVHPVTGRIEWEYIADPPEAFFTRTRGSCQRLPNGNTLVCESNSGRFFEITREGEIVWEWFNPETSEGRRELIYRVERLAPEVIEPLLAGPDSD